MPLADAQGETQERGFIFIACGSLVELKSLAEIASPRGWYPAACSVGFCHVLGILWKKKSSEPRFTPLLSF